MSLRSIHRAASSAKLKTAACLKHVFTSLHHSKSSALLTRSSSWFFTSSDSHQGEGRQLHGTELAASSNDHGRKFDLLNLTAKSSSDDDTADEEGYVTANDDSVEFKDKDSENDSDGTDDDRRTINGMHGEFSEDGRHLQSESSGNQNERGGLPVSQSQPINDLRDSVVELESEEQLKKVDDATLLRFLIARNMDVAKAADMFIKDWRWRNQFAPRGYISEAEVSHQLEAEKAFLQGIDKYGRPVMIILGSKHFSRGRDMDEFKRYCFYCIEKVIASIPEGKDKFVTIMDIGGTGYKNMDTSASIMMADFLQAHYPERMGKLYVVHVSSMFQMPYKLVEPAIDVKTRAKITFVGNDQDLDSVLKEDLGDEVLPKLYGGSADLIPIQNAQVDRGSFPSRAVLAH